MFAGAAQAPITAVIILFELTGEYTIILPLMSAIVLASGVSHLLSRDTIYTLKLRRRGIDIDAHPQSARLTTTTAAQVMEPVGRTLRADSSLLDAAELLGRTRHGQLPVMDASGVYIGLATARAIADTLADGQHDCTAVETVVEQAPTVTADQTLETTLDALDQSSTPAIPVLEATTGDVLGWLTHQRVLRALHHAPLPEQVGGIA